MVITPSFLSCSFLSERPVSETSCPLTAEAEFEFWGLGEIFLQPCCAIKYFPRTVSAHIEKHEARFYASFL